MNVNTSFNPSGLLHSTCSTNEIATQTEWNDNLSEGSRNFKDSIKIAFAASHAAANIFQHQSRIAFEKFFGAQYHLSADETSPEPKHKTPFTTEQFEPDKDVLPSVKTIAWMKHLMAKQQEWNAAYSSAEHDTIRCCHCALRHYHHEKA